MKRLMKQLAKNGWAIVAITILALPVQAAVDAKTQLVRVLKQGFTFQGNFSQSVTDGAGRRYPVTRGTFKIKRPGKFLWQYRGKNGIKIISTGKRVYVEDPKLKQVTHASVKRALGKSPAMVLLRPDLLQTEFHLVNSGSSSGVHWVRLIPKKGKSKEFEHVFVGMGGKNLSELKKIRVMDAENRTIVMSFSNLRYDQPLSDSLFKYKPPSMFDSY
jgi:outer membrane lipoprotein carrier protein